MSSGRIMGIDYGAVRIGISLSDETMSIAFGREVIQNDEDSLKKITGLIEEYRVHRVVLGYPLSLKGAKTAQTHEVESFEKRLKDFLDIGKVAVKIIRWDERFTSKMAQSSMLESGMKKKKRQNKSNLDIISAALLLQSYLDSLDK